MGEIKKVQIRNGFSDRNNINKLNEKIQIDSFDERTRIQLYNYFMNVIENDGYGYTIDNERFYLEILNNAYCEVIEYDDYYDMEKYVQLCTKYIKDTFLSKESSYDEILSLIEYMTNLLDEEYIPKQNKKYYIDNDDCLYNIKNKQYTMGVQYIYIRNQVNEIFEKECVGYRFIGENIVAITDKNEINEIEQACDAPYNGCKAHIEKAVGFLADREHKDYKNCIKESISAVESVCKIIVGDEKATLGEAIKKLKEKGIKFHQALEKSFSMLFGYTSDEGGIRHAEGLFVSEVSFEEAKFMLVSCSAFVNYLIAEYGKIDKD